MRSTLGFTYRSRTPSTHALLAPAQTESLPTSPHAVHTHQVYPPPALPTPTPPQPHPIPPHPTPPKPHLSPPTPPPKPIRLDTTWSEDDPPRSNSAQPHPPLPNTVGGNGRSACFSSTVSSVKKRTRFVSALIDLCEKAGFDGVDLNWVQPQSVPINQPANQPCMLCHFFHCTTTPTPPKQVSKVSL